MAEGSAGPDAATLAGAWASRMARHPWPVIAVVLVLALLSLYYAAHTITVNTDTVDMLDEELPFRQVQDRFREEFPSLTLNMVLVAEAPTPEQARQAAAAMRDGLAAQGERFPRISWPAGSDFLERNGLLLLSLDELDALGDQLSRAQPLLSQIAADTRIASLFDLLAAAAREPDAPVDDLGQLYSGLAASLDSVVLGAPQPLSWQRLIGSQQDGAADETAREILVVEPQLDFDRVMAGRRAMEDVDALRRELGLDDGPVQLKVTGNVALAYEELVASLEGAQLAGSLALLVVVIIMFIGLRSLRLVAVALLSLAVGFSFAVGFAALAVGELNLISIAFALLYIGLGVNYAVHFLLRYREQLARGLERHAAIVASGRILAGALCLSAATTALGFFAFVPTAYAGFAELGLIAGVSMGITLLISYTLIPALLGLLPSPGRLHYDTRTVLPESWLALPIDHRLWMSALALLLGIAAALLATQLRFDSDPLNLREAESESVQTLRALLEDAESGYRNLQLLAEDGDEARALEPRLERLSEVAEVTSLWSFVPEAQEEKFATLADLRLILGRTIMEADWQPEPTAPSELEASIERLHGALGEQQDAPQARALRAALARLETAMDDADAEALTASTEHAVLSTLPGTMNRMTRALQADEPVTLSDLPESLTEMWRSPSGAWLIQIAPVNPAVEIPELAGFIEQVRSVKSGVTGMPVLQLESGQAITEAFLQAILWAVLGITLVLLVVLREITASIKVLTPLALGGLLAAAVMVLADVPFNFANVIALPLLLGVGVDNGVHLVYRYHHGELPDGNVLRTATARGIVFAALTTVLSFGNLMLSPHSGTASMGFVLAVGLTFMVVATLLVLPALLGRGSTS